MKTMLCAMAGFLFACTAGAGEREETYYREKCLPLVRAFIRTNQLAFEPDFPTNKISHWGIEYSTNTGNFLSRTMLEKRLAFTFIGNEKYNRIEWFHDKAAWRPGMLDPNKTTEMRSWAARINLLNTNTALALARETFRRQGHSETNFHPVMFEQVVWGEPTPTRRIVLPFYKAVWARRDVKLPSINSFYPSVHIVVSGVNSNVVEYTTALLPFVPGQDWGDAETKDGRNKKGAALFERARVAVADARDWLFPDNLERLRRGTITEEELQEGRQVVPGTNAVTGSERKHLAPQP